MADPARRRAALLATLVAVPLVIVAIIVLALVQAPDAPTPTITSQPSGTILPAVTPAAPPNDPAAVASCTKLIGALPVTLGMLAGRPSRPVANYQTFTAAWGDPAVVLRCGVPRPAALTPSARLIATPDSDVNYLEVDSGADHVFTVVDRPVYLDLSVPSAYPDAFLVQVSQAVTKVLPQVCTGVQANSSLPAGTPLCGARR